MLFFKSFFIYKILGFYLTTTVIPSTEPKNKKVEPFPLLRFKPKDALHS